MIKLITKKVSKKRKEYDEIKTLLITAFPKNEQMPMWLLQILSLRTKIEFLAYYADDEFCGISYTVCDKKMIFVLYLAVNDKVRSKGYGSLILDEIKNKYKGKSISLNIEPIDSQAVNYEQRVKRLEFYKRNGFLDTGYYIQDDNDKYLILSTAERFELEEYISAIRKLSYGLHTPKVVNA